MLRQILTIAILLLCLTSRSQVRIGTTDGLPEASAMFEIKSNEAGFIPPVLTDSLRDNIPSPAKGLIIFNSTTETYNFFDGTEWRETEHGNATPSAGTAQTGKGVIISDVPGKECDSSAILQLYSKSRGLLIPRTTPASVTDPAEGLLIYDVLTDKPAFYTGTEWIELCGAPTGSSGIQGSQDIKGIAVKEDNSDADQSAILDVQSATKGILFPRMTSQERDLIRAVPGVTIYNVTSKEIQYYSGTGWEKIEHTLTASIIISVNPSEWICSSQSSSVTFTASVTNGGASPLFRWYINGDPVPGNSSSVNIPVNNDDEIMCIMNSDNPCVSGSDVFSNTIIIKVWPTPGTSAIIFN